MSALRSFFGKELLAQLRTGKLLFLLILFALFGVMNPAIAKLTPWLLELFSDSLAGSGMTVTEVTVTARDSWGQFFKNIPMALIAFVLLEGGIFTGEYRAGTLTLSLSRGLCRYQVVLAKAAVLLILFTVGYLLCFLITYGYTAYFWDQSTVHHLATAVFCYWLFGVLTISLLCLFSTLLSEGAGVLLGTGAVILVLSLVGLIPGIRDYLPTALTDGTSLILGAVEPAARLAPILITAAASLACFFSSIPIFNQKRL